MSETVPLSKPIQAHGETLSALTLNRPTPAQARQIRALPYVMGADESVNINTDVAAKYISACAGIPPSSVDQLELADFNALCWQVAGFFMSSASESQASSPASPTTSPISGDSTPN